MPGINAADQQETLGKILKGLESQDINEQMSALQDLKGQTYSSPAILRLLEKLVLHSPNQAIRRNSLQLIDSPVHKYIAGRLQPLPHRDREIILAEIEKWSRQELLQSEQAALLKLRYGFDMPISIPELKQSEPMETTQPGPDVVNAEAAAPLVEAKPTAPPAPEPKPIQPQRKLEPSVPRPTLIQTLLSETSIKVALYLGAFFVIASALILAALSEQARLPILLAVTVLFAAGAFALKKRLPQPSFALFIVFSCLLPIIANVLSDTLHLSGTTADIYWTIVFMAMALVWAFSVWFYMAWFFSLVSFVSLGLAFLRFCFILHASTDVNIFSIELAALTGLAGVRLLKGWQGNKFALPLFILLQILQPVVLLFSLGSLLTNYFDTTLVSTAWIVNTSTWLAAFVFYILSDQLFEFIPFPWAGVGTLLPAAWIFLQTFHPSPLIIVIGQLAWGTMMAGVSEFAFHQAGSKFRRYHWPLLAGSLALFITGTLFAIDDVKYTLAALTVTALVYAVLMIVRPRMYVWTAALLAGLGAYFTFFNLPSLISLSVPTEYKLLIASLFLLVPELFFKSSLSVKESWRWPAFTLGAILTFINYLLILFGMTSAANAAIGLGLYALLVTAHALHFRIPALGYLASASAALSLNVMLDAIHLDIWLPLLTGLAVIYYLAGVFLKKRAAAWSDMLRISGLALGAILAALAFIYSGRADGWYILAIAGMFAAEMFIRPAGWLEPAPLGLFSLAMFMILRDLQVNDPSYYLLTFSLIWLGGDAILKQTFHIRRMQWTTRVLGGIFAAANFVILCATQPASNVTVACFAVYTVFFAAYALFYRQPRLGYAATASLAFLLYFILNILHLDAWLPVLTGLAVIYYMAGYLIKTRALSWAVIFRFSGLALAGILSLTALLLLKPGGGWYVLVGGIFFIAEMRIHANGPWLEPAPLLHFSAASFLILHDVGLADLSYVMLACSLIWLGGDLLFRKIVSQRKLAWPMRFAGTLFVAATVLGVLTQTNDLQGVICFGIFTIFFAVYAWIYQRPMLGYASSASLPVAVYFALSYSRLHPSLIPAMIIAIVYYAAGYVLRRAKIAAGWESLFLFSGLGLGIVLALLAPVRGGLDSSLPVAVTATFVAFEAFYRRNVWLGFPANLLYLESYFIILGSLHVDQPQYFSIGTAALGMLMHYLLTRAGSRRAAFLTGFFSQFVLLGTSYIQLVATQNLAYFAVIFLQALAVLAYGIIGRSRSLLLTPIAFSVLATITVVYKIVKDLGTVVLVGCTGIILLLLGIAAVILRERISTFTERFKDWNA